MSNIYISSDGTEKDVREMPFSYLKNSLAKAQRADAGDEQAQANIPVLEAEIARREATGENN